VFQKLTCALNEHCSGTKEPYDRPEEGIPDQSQAAPVISLINPRTISPYPRYVDGSDTIPRRGLRHDAVVRGPESEQTTVKGPGFSRTGGFKKTAYPIEVVSLI
jgi:hypothetical protein